MPRGRKSDGVRSRCGNGARASQVAVAMGAIRTRRSLEVARGVVRALARPVLVRALAVAIAAGIPAALVFSPSGMRAADLVHLLHASPLARALLWATWLLFAAAPARAVFDAPGSSTLRALCLPRGPRLAALLFLSSLVHAPWMALFARGGGVLEAWGATMLAVAMEAALVVAARRPRTWAVVAVLAGSLVLEAPLLLRAVAGTLLAVGFVERAWAVGAEQRVGALRIVRPSPPVVALTVMYLLRLVRAERSRAAIAVLSAAAGTVGLVVAHAEPSERPLPRALAILALPLVVVAAVCVAPILECEAVARAALVSLRGSRRPVMVAAFAFAIAVPASALGATASATATACAQAVPLGFAGPIAVWGAALGEVVAAWGRVHEGWRRGSAALFSAGVAAIALVAAMVASAW